MRALVTIRYVRRWYADDSRDVSAIPGPVWNALTIDQQAARARAVSHYSYESARQRLEQALSVVPTFAPKARA